MPDNQPDPTKLLQELNDVLTRHGADIEAGPDWVRLKVGTWIFEVMQYEPHGPVKVVEVWNNTPSGVTPPRTP